MKYQPMRPRCSHCGALIHAISEGKHSDWVHTSTNREQCNNPRRMRLSEGVKVYARPSREH